MLICNLSLEIGIAFNDDLQLEVADPSALTDALRDNARGVIHLFSASSGIASQITGLISPFTESEGIIDQVRESTNDQISMIDDRISSLEAQLSKKETYYRNRLASMQQALNMALQNQALFNSISEILG